MRHFKQKWLKMGMLTRETKIKSKAKDMTEIRSNKSMSNPTLLKIIMIRIRLLIKDNKMKYEFIIIRFRFKLNFHI